MRRPSQGRRLKLVLVSPPQPVPCLIPSHNHADDDDDTMALEVEAGLFDTRPLARPLSLALHSLV